MRDPLDGYPDVERHSRRDGSPEAVQACLQPVKDALPAIRRLIEEVCTRKQLFAVHTYLFQSRAMGTCKPGSDIDVYLALEPHIHGETVDRHGVLYKDTGVKVICGEWAVAFFTDLPEPIKRRLAELRLDLFLGVEATPPAKAEYRGKPYYLDLEALP